MTSTNANDNTALSSSEALQYDRQIRLWGVEAQQRMRETNILIIGLGVLGAEVAKNIILAGMSITILDNNLIVLEDLGGQFFLQESDIGNTRANASAKRLTELNKFAKIDIISQDISVTSLSDELLSTFSLVIHCGKIDGPKEQLNLAERCRRLNVPVIIAMSAGFWGAFALDYGPSYSYRIERTILPSVAGGDATTAVDSKTLSYSPLSTLPLVPLDEMWPSKRSAAFGSWATYMLVASGLVNDKAESPSMKFNSSSSLLSECERVARTLVAKSTLTYDVAIHSQALQSFAEYAGSELSAVSAVLGGQLGQEVIKLVSRKGEPINQLFIFDAMGGTGGSVYKKF
jgi:ubiquitin-like 1-activating enzyme E1 A